MSEIERKRPLIRLLDGDADDAPTKRLVSRLSHLAVAMDVVHEFKVGQIVKWNAGLKNRKIPAYDEPAIVRDIMDPPIYDNCELSGCAGSPNFREPLTIVIGLIDPDGDFIELRVDGRRFKMFNG